MGNIIKIEVHPNRSMLRTSIPYDVKTRLYSELSYKVFNYAFTKAHKNFGWDGTRSLFKSSNLSFPTGVLERVVDILSESYTVNCIYTNDYKPLGDGKILDIDLYDFQKKAVDAVIDHKYGIIDIPVRGGKTAIIASIISRIQQYPIVVITFGSDLVVQTKAELERFLGKEVGYFYKGKLQLSDIIVTDFQAIVKIKKDGKSTKERNEGLRKFVNECKVLLIDECHFAYTQKFKNILAMFNNTGYRIGLSGTPKPDDKHKLELEENIGPIIHKISFDKLINLGRIVQPVIYMYDLPKSWYTSYLSSYSEYYDANIVQNEKRNEFIVRLVKKLQDSGKTVFVVVQKRYHGETLSNMIDKSIYTHGEIDSDIRKQLYARLDKKEITCIVSTVGKVGLNIPNLDVVINAEGLMAHTSTIQKLRSLTAAEGKDIGIIVDFLDKGAYTFKHAKSRLSQYENLKGFKIKKIEVRDDKK